MQKKIKKILIAEDEKALARALELKLKKSGFKVVVTKDGSEALEKIKSEKPDLVLLNLIMPKMDGFDVLGKLKKSVPIIIISNLSQEEDILRAKNLGASDYFVKADTPLVDIVDRVRKILG